MLMVDGEEQKIPNRDMEQDRLTDWKKEPSLADLKLDYEGGKTNRDNHVNKVDSWLDNYHVRGDAKPTKVKNRSNIQPALIRKQAEWRYPSLTEPFLNTQDIFKGSPRTFEDTESARQNTLVLNYQWNQQLGKIKLVNKIIKTAVDEGTVIIRYGWEFKTTMVDEEVPVVELRPAKTEEEIQILDQALQLEQTNPNGFADLPPEMKEAIAYVKLNGQPVVGTIVRYETQKVEKTLVNRPTVEVCDYRSITVDPTCDGEFEKAQFIVHTFETSYGILSKDSRYKNLENIQLTENMTDTQYISEMNSSNYAFKDKPRKKVVVHEYWGFYDIDGKGEVKPIVAAWIGNTLVRLEESPFADRKLPFVMIPYIDVSRDIFGEPDGALLEDNQKIVGAVTRGIIDTVARTAAGQQGVRKQFLDVVNKKKFDRGEDYEFNPAGHPTDSIYIHKAEEIPQSSQFLLQLNNYDAESTTGVKSFANTGINSTGFGEVAAGIRGALDAASKREMSILRRIADGITEVGRRIISMNAEFLGEVEVIRITNDKFMPIKRDDLRGEIDLILDIASAEENEARAQQLSFMMQTLGNNIPFEFTKMILVEFAELRRLPALAKSIKEYVQEPDPMDQAMKQAAVQKAQLENQEIQAKIAKIMRETELLGAKTITEGEKGKVLNANADQADLDIVEQESGTKHARDVDLQTTQAKGNMELERVKQGGDRIKVLADYLKS